MGLNPVPWAALVIGHTVIIALLTTGTAEDPENITADCDVFSLDPGCDTNIDNLILGTVPGAPALLNTALAVLRFVTTAALIWSIVQLFRGV